MAITFQITIDCRDPEPLVRFWAEALGYVVKDPPEGFATWNDWYVSVGVPEDELPATAVADRLVDPAGVEPPIWFQTTRDELGSRSRIHLDLDVGFDAAGGKLPYAERVRLVEAKRAELEAVGGTVQLRVEEPEHDHYHVTLADPEGNVLCLR